MLTTILISLILLSSCFDNDTNIKAKHPKFILSTILIDLQRTITSEAKLSGVLIANRYDSLSKVELQKEYQKQLQKIKLKKNKADNLDSLGSYLHVQLTTEIFPAWYGTEWDYNGYTNHPKKGMIACGYFVSTTLKHVGFNLNRFDLAKMYSLNIVESLCGTPNTFTDIDNLLAYLHAEKDNLYVVGLSNHVGFLEKKNGEIYFIHANYMGPVAVEKELAKESDALNSSDIFVLGNITGNLELIKKWKNDNEINIIK